MKCERCKKETYCVYINRNYEKLCGTCCDKEEAKKKKAKK